MRQELDRGKDEEEALKFRMNPEEDADEADSVLPPEEEKSYEDFLTSKVVEGIALRNCEDNRDYIKLCGDIYRVEQLLARKEVTGGKEIIIYSDEDGDEGNRRPTQLEILNAQKAEMIAAAIKAAAIKYAENWNRKHAHKDVPSTAISPAEDPNNKPDDRSLGLT